jgi:molybdenum cofactor synthesis domain-containing protein
MPTAAVVVIGDEILSGKFPDENGTHLIRRLRQLGCDLRRLVVVSDDPADIADEVRRCAAAHDHVLTTGGVGPTHDDRTLEGVALAFGVPLETRAELVALLDHFGLARSETNLRMATVPAGSELVTVPRSSFPIVRTRNVWIFPGIPKLMHAKFEEIAGRFAGEQVRTDRLYTDQQETEIAAVLMAVAERHPSVVIGSYPRFGEGDYKVIVTLESRDDPALAAASAELRSALSLVAPNVR